MNYTLICYKPESYDRCGDRYGSDFELYESTDIEEIIKEYVEKIVANNYMDSQEVGYDLTLLTNGVTVDSWNDDYCKVVNESEKLASQKIIEIDEAKRIKEEAKKLIEAENKIKREQEEYFRLKAKFEINKIITTGR